MVSCVPASVAQRLLWMIQHHRPDFGALSCPLLCRIRGPLDPDALVTALAALTARHGSLRTTFAGRGARLTQEIHDPAPPTSLRRIDLSALGRGPAESAVWTAIRVELTDPVDPEVWPARLTLWRIAAAEHVLCVNLHHLVTDAWSTGVLLRDLVALYRAAVDDDAPALPGPGWQYADFSAWQQRLLASDELRRHGEYWRRQLDGTQLCRLRQAFIEADPTAPAAPSGMAALELDTATVAGLRELARARHTTMFAVLLAGFYATLSRLTGQPDLAVGSMFANRSRPELRETVGLLANMVLLRARIPRGASFADLVSGAHAAVIGAFTYQDLPHQMLPMDVVQSAGARADDVMFQVMASVEHRLAAGTVDFELLLPEDIGSRFPFELTLTPIGDDRMRAVLFHAEGWCDAAAANGFLAGYAELLDAAVRRPDAVLASAAAAQ